MRAQRARRRERVCLPDEAKAALTRALGNDVRSVQQEQSDEKSGDTWHRVERSSQVRVTAPRGRMLCVLAC